MILQWKNKRNQWKKKKEKKVPKNHLIGDAVAKNIMIVMRVMQMIIIIVMNDTMIEKDNTVKIHHQHKNIVIKAMMIQYGND
eukprot:8680345-Ditylum_brightwellii.AAC.1